MPENTDVYADPAGVVRRFIADMHDWEARTLLDHRSLDPAEADAFWVRTRTSLGDIFARWCTPKERKYGRLGSFADPPEYQPEHEVILKAIAESPSRACVYTQQGTGFRHKRMYVLLKKSDRWLIDNVKRWQASMDKWANGIL
jgi:hypothetical protein